MKVAIEKTSLKLNPAESVLIAMYGATIGKVGILKLAATTNQACCACQTFDGVYNKYLFYFLLANRKNFVKQGVGGAQPNISKEKILATLCPLPPMDEQKRIVERLEKILAEVELLAESERELDNLQKNFPRRMKNSILQAAIQGKLTEQLSTDGDARELLKKIREEKSKLIAEGKIKSEKILPPITADEIPFDIPKNWQWVRLGDICEYIQRGKSPKYSIVKKYPVIAQKCNQTTGFCIDKAKFIEPDSIKSYSDERFLQDNDLLWNSTGLGTVGRMAIYETSKNPYELAVADSHVTVIRPFKNFVANKFIFNYIISPAIQENIETMVSGSITPTFKIPINFEMFQAYTKFLKKNIFGFIVDGVITFNQS